MNVRVPADAAFIPPDTGASTNWTIMMTWTQLSLRNIYETALFFMLKLYDLTTLNLCLFWYLFTQCWINLTSLERKVLQMYFPSLTVLQSISRLPLITLSRTSWKDCQYAKVKTKSGTHLVHVFHDCIVWQHCNHPLWASSHLATKKLNFTKIKRENSRRMGKIGLLEDLCWSRRTLSSFSNNPWHCLCCHIICQHRVTLQYILTLKGFNDNTGRTECSFSPWWPGSRPSLSPCCQDQWNPRFCLQMLDPSTN